jgi:hypothetical protein
MVSHGIKISGPDIVRLTLVKSCTGFEQLTMNDGKMYQLGKTIEFLDNGSELCNILLINCIS